VHIFRENEKKAEEGKRLYCLGSSIETEKQNDGFSVPNNLLQHIREHFLYFLNDKQTFLCKTYLQKPCYLVIGGPVYIIIHNM
jgi:hypothetical protein